VFSLTGWFWDIFAKPPLSKISAQVAAAET
jgi:hypothetical protein